VLSRARTSPRRASSTWAAALALAALALAGATDARAQGDDDVIQRPERMTAGTADQLLGQLAPDGKTLYYVSNRNTTNELYRQEQDSPGSKLVFDEGADVTWPRLSPDGKRILYISFRGDASGQLCVRDLPDKKRRCLDGGGALQAQWIGNRRIALVSTSSPQGDLRILTVDVGRRLSARALVDRNLLSPTVSPDGRWMVYVPIERYVERIGPGFAARAADRLEAMRLDRPGDAPVPLPLDLPGLTGQPAFSVDGKFLYVTQFLNDTNGDGTVDASDHGVLFRVPFESARDDAPLRASKAWPEQLTESIWNCQYPSPSATILVATCARPGAAGGLDVYSLPLDGQVPDDWSAERLSLEVAFSVRRSEQALMFRRLLSKQTTVTGRRVIMMRLLRNHLAADEFDAADFYAKKIKTMPDPATAGMATALRLWVEQRRADVARERGRMAGEFVSDSRERFEKLDPAKMKSKAPAAIALKRVVRSEIADTLGEKDVARAELEAAPLDEVTVPSVLHSWYERADALYRELDDRDALVAADRRLSEHPALDPTEHLRFARAAVRALIRGLSYDEADAALARVDAPPESELAFAVALFRAVNTIRVEEPPKSVRNALVAFYRGQTRHDRQRAIMLEAVQRASRLEAEKLIEALAQLYVDDVPRGTQERRRAERLFERVMLSRAYRRLAKGHLASARDTFKLVADTTGSLEAHVGYVDARLREGVTTAQLRAEYDQRNGPGGAPAREFVRAYLLARELPTMAKKERPAAIDEGIARLRKVSPALRGKPEPQVIWGALLHERYLDDHTLASAQKANTHYLLALELVARNPRYRSHVLSELALIQEQVGNWRIALGFLQQRDKLPVADTPAGIEHWLVEARTLMHVDREADAAAVADKALAIVDKTPELGDFRALVLDRAALYNFAAGRFDRALGLYDDLLPSVHGDRNVVVAHLARAGAALGAGQARRAVADLDVVDGALRDDRAGPALEWPHTTRETTLRGYRLIAAGLRANAHLKLGELAAAQATLERRRALAVERLKSTGLDAHLRGLGLVEARLADVARDRHDVAAANRWLRLALDDTRAYRHKLGLPLLADQLDLIRFAAELRLDGQLQLPLKLGRALNRSVDKMAAAHDAAFRVDQRWFEVYGALLAPR